MKDIHERLKRFAVDTVRFVQTFPRAPGVFRIADQVVGSGTSPAANAREADSARTNPEFISCFGIALKELNEIHFWLEIVQELRWGNMNETTRLLRECDELGRIVATIIINAKKNSRRYSL